MTILSVSYIFSFFNSPLILIVLGSICLISFIFIFWKANHVTNKYRKFFQQEMVNKASNLFPKKDYFVACAGSKDSDATIKASAIDINLCEFLDSNRRPLDLSLYNCFIVHGDSMKYAGIDNNDFIFVPKEFNIEDLDHFPEILVIKYRQQKEEKPMFKVRRAWYRGTINGNFEEILSEIIKLPKFHKLTQQEGYKGSDWMIKDFIDKRLTNYKSNYFKEDLCPEKYRQIVISTTFDPIKKEIHFSIHPITLIVGNVVAAYPHKPSNI